MIFREMYPPEAEFLKEMLYESLFVPEGKERYPRSVLERPELAKYYLKWGSIPHDLAYVAEDNGTLIGAVWGRAHQPPHQGYGYIDSDIPEIGIALKSSHRNRGVGTRLLKLISEHYATLEVCFLSLSVDKLNPAKKLYDRQGFLVVVENEKILSCSNTCSHKGAGLL